MKPLTPPRVALVLFAVFALLYGATMARWLAHTDSPEFVSLFAMGGVAHPPGFPTIVLILRAFSWLPLDPKIGAGLVTACAGAGAIALLFLAARAWRSPTPSAAVAAALVGLNSQVWLVHTHPEAFAFNNLFAAAILWLAAPHGPLQGSARAAALGLVGGLSLGGHPSIVLLAPIGLYGIFRSVRESSKPPLPLLLAGTLFALGLTPYGYLLVTDSPISFGRIETFNDVIDHFLRREYGTTRLAADGTSNPGEQLAFFVTESVLDFAVVGFCLGLLGAARAIADEPGEEAVPLRERPQVLLVVTWVLAGPLFVLLFNSTPEGPHFEIVKRFHVLPALLMGLLIALALERFEGTARNLEATAVAVTVAIFAVAGWMRTQAVYDSSIEDWILNALQTAPEDAVLISQGDHRHFGAQYMQVVEDVRPDVTYITAATLGMRWYVDDRSRHLGIDLPDPIALDDGAQRVPIREILDLLLTEGRDVIVTDDAIPEVLAEYRAVPYGVGFRLLRDDESEPTPAALVATNEAIYERFVHRSPPPVYERNIWGWSVYSSYFAVWRDLAARCRDAGDEACVDRATRMLERYPDL